MTRVHDCTGPESQFLEGRKRAPFVCADCWFSERDAACAAQAEEETAILSSACAHTRQPDAEVQEGEEILTPRTEARRRRFAEHGGAGESGAKRSVEAGHEGDKRIVKLQRVDGASNGSNGRSQAVDAAPHASAACGPAAVQPAQRRVVLRSAAEQMKAAAADARPTPFGDGAGTLPGDTLGMAVAANFVFLSQIRKGFVFKASKATIGEVRRRCLFGAERALWAVVQQHVEVGTTALFLYNYSEQTLEGVFVATHAPGLNIEPEAWASFQSKKKKKHRNERSGAAAGSAFPAQVRVTKMTEWVPVPRDSWQHCVCWTSAKDFEQVPAHASAMCMPAFAARICDVCFCFCVGGTHRRGRGEGACRHVRAQLLEGRGRIDLTCRTGPVVRASVASARLPEPVPRRAQ